MSGRGHPHDGHAGHHRTRSAGFLARTLRHLDKQVAEAIPRVVDMTDEEAVHDMRVAIRRLRTLLRLARPVYGRFHADVVRLGFARIQQATGDLRDEEALFETFGSLAIVDPAFDAWQARRRARDRRLRGEVIRRIRSGELLAPRKLLHALLVLPVDPAHNLPLTKLARRCVARAGKEVEALRDVSTDDVQGMHDLRIAYKKLRYAAEFFASALPPELAQMAEVAARFQKRLGDVHDVDVALASVARARGLTPSTRARVLKALREQRDRRINKFQSEMAPAQTVHAAPGAPGARAESAPDEPEASS
jgi:CHAD domain-containing protein